MVFVDGTDMFGVVLKKSIVTAEMRMKEARFRSQKFN